MNQNDPINTGDNMQASQVNEPVSAHNVEEPKERKYGSIFSPEQRASIDAQRTKVTPWFSGEQGAERTKDAKEDSATPETPVTARPKEATGQMERHAHSTDGYCNVCSRPMKAIPGEQVGYVCKCMGIQPYAMSCYPGEYRLVKTHPDNSGEQWYKRSEIDPLLQDAQEASERSGTLPAATATQNARIQKALNDLRSGWTESAEEILSDLLFVTSVERKTDARQATERDIKLRAADKMAWVCDDWVQRGIIGSRSALADARLNYGQPFSYEWSKLKAPTIDAAMGSDASEKQTEKEEGKEA